MGKETVGNGQFSPDEIAEAVLRAGVNPQKIMRILEQMRDMQPGTLQYDSHTSEVHVPLRADETGSLEIPYELTESDPTDVSFESDPSEDDSPLIRFDGNPGEQIMLRLPF